MPHIIKVVNVWFLFQNELLDLRVSVCHQGSNFDTRFFKEVQTPDQPLLFHTDTAFHFIALWINRRYKVTSFKNNKCSSKSSTKSLAIYLPVQVGYQQLSLFWDPSRNMSHTLQNGQYCQHACHQLEIQFPSVSVPPVGRSGVIAIYAARKPECSYAHDYGASFLRRFSRALH